MIRFCIACLLFPLWAFAQTAPAPEMTVAEKFLDLGTIGPKDRKAFEYVVQNTGNAPLQITKATASCGCTVASYPKKPILPGQSAPLKVVYKANPHNLGYQHKTITVLTNEPGGEPFYLNFRINVELPD